MMTLAEANNRAMDRRIGTCREAIRKIDEVLSMFDVLGDASLAHLIAAKMLIQNQITVYEAGRCNLH